MRGLLTTASVIAFCASVAFLALACLGGWEWCSEYSMAHPGTPPEGLEKGSWGGAAADGIRLSHSFCAIWVFGAIAAALFMAFGGAMALRGVRRARA